MSTAIKHPVLDRVKPSFVIFDIRAVWHRMLYSKATMGVKWLRETATLDGTVTDDC